jgi:hypothetical protein
MLGKTQTSPDPDRPRFLAGIGPMESVNRTTNLIEQILGKKLDKLTNTVALKEQTEKLGLSQNYSRNEGSGSKSKILGLGLSQSTPHVVKPLNSSDSDAKNKQKQAIERTKETADSTTLQGQPIEKLGQSEFDLKLMPVPPLPQPRDDPKSKLRLDTMQMRDNASSDVEDDMEEQKVAKVAGQQKPKNPSPPTPLLPPSTPPLQPQPVQVHNKKQEGSVSKQASSQAQNDKQNPALPTPAEKQDDTLPANIVNHPDLEIGKEDSKGTKRNLGLRRSFTDRDSSPRQGSNKVAPGHGVAMARYPFYNSGPKITSPEGSVRLAGQREEGSYEPVIDSIQELYPFNGADSRFELMSVKSNFHKPQLNNSGSERNIARYNHPGDGKAKKITEKEPTDRTSSTQKDCHGDREPKVASSPLAPLVLQPKTKSILLNRDRIGQDHLPVLDGVSVRSPPRPKPLISKTVSFSDKDTIHRVESYKEYYKVTYANTSDDCCSSCTLV